MKTIKQVLADFPQYKTLINAVLKRIGKDRIEDVIRSGADAGFSGFIYCSETHAFAMRFRKDIIALLKDQASDMGTEVVEMVSHFGVFRNPGFDETDRQETYLYLGGAKVQQSTVTNVMAWFALEEVCRMFEN